MSENKIKPCQSCPGLLRQAAVHTTQGKLKILTSIKKLVCQSLKLCSLLVEILLRLRGDILSAERSHFVIDVYLKYFLEGRRRWIVIEIHRVVIFWT